MSGDSLAPEAVEPLLTGRFGRPYAYAERCESTQTLIDRSGPEGAVAVAEEQTAGRGRLRRAWEAPRGSSILCSILLRPPPGPDLAQLSLVGGLAAAEAVEDALGLAAQIKWPNDVMVNRRKVAGVLAESREDVVVLGIGINVSQERTELPPATVAPASLRTVDGAAHERAPLLASLLARVEHNYDGWLDRGLDAIYDGLGSRDFLRGRTVTVDGATGEAVGISRAGALVVEVGGELRTIEAGEVTYKR
ncbi:MAG TPA: biotin--[acetyl-CoA-carboxylase] ligase [Gaiellaceae bacterium]|nr:biotin--[acetyl-CoA-carboxylase] ligase [Gaiellaceae bacterium]